MDVKPGDKIHGLETFLCDTPRAAPGIPVPGFAVFAGGNIGAVGAGRPVPADASPGDLGRTPCETPPIHNPPMKARQIFDKITNL